MLQFEPGKAPITLTAAAVERAKYLIEKSVDKEDLKDKLDDIKDKEDLKDKLDDIKDKEELEVKE